MSLDASFVVRAGAGALAHVAANGIAREDIACLPAAAGGPKGLALIPLDRLLHREWLHGVGSMELIGASVGAWRAAALAQPDPIAALDRLQQAYVHDQRYDGRPSPHDVSCACRRIARAVIGDGALVVRPGLTLGIITARARGALASRDSKLAFGRAVLSNTLSRARLAAHLERVIFEAGEPSRLAHAFDAFGLTRIDVGADNAEDALLASGTIPLICTPVRDIARAPRGKYWDGALIDYHLLLPYSQLTGPGGGTRRRLVLYPHFNDYVTPGWLDKHLAWRRAPRTHPWLDDVLLVAPSPAMIAALPNGRLPSRQDFYQYGADHEGRERAWVRAIGECERFAVDVMRWLERPDPDLIRPL